HRILPGASAAGQGSVPVQLQRRAARPAQEGEPEGLHGAHAAVLRPPSEGGADARVDGQGHSLPGAREGEGTVPAADIAPGRAFGRRRCGGGMRILTRETAPRYIRPEGIVSYLLASPRTCGAVHLAASLVEIQPGGAQRVHAHDPEQLYFILEGSGRMTVGT